MVLLEKEDFEKAIGHTLTEDDWILANDLYQHTTLSYDDFVKCHIKGNVKDLLRDLVNQLNENEVKDTIAYNTLQEFAYDVLDEAVDTCNDNLFAMTKKFIGRNRFIEMCLERGYRLDREDREYVLAHLRFE